jgi:hypothetical protein
VYIGAFEPFVGHRVLREDVVKREFKIGILLVIFHVHGLT